MAWCLHTIRCMLNTLQVSTFPAAAHRKQRPDVPAVGSSLSRPLAQALGHLVVGSKTAPGSLRDACSSSTDLSGYRLHTGYRHFDSIYSDLLMSTPLLHLFYSVLHTFILKEHNKHNSEYTLQIYKHYSAYNTAMPYPFIHTPGPCEVLKCRVFCPSLSVT